MCKTRWMVLSVLTAILLVGCSKQSDPDTKPVATSNNGQTQLEGPAAAAYEFLDALRTGNDEKATKMLSAVAREKTAALNRNVTPPASDTARFTVGKVDYVGEDGARVHCTWTDIDGEGQPKTDEAVWVLRREEDGWRIAGVAAQIFPGEPPLLLNFEDPEDMFRKQQWVREEIRRRMEAEALQAKTEEKSDESIRR